MWNVFGLAFIRSLQLKHIPYASHLNLNEISLSKFAFVRSLICLLAWGTLATINSGCQLRLARSIDQPTSNSALTPASPSSSSDSFETLIPSLTFSPSTMTLDTYERYPFQALGSSSAPSYSISSGNGSVDPMTGLFTAPSVPGFSTLRAIDSQGAVGSAQIAIRGSATVDDYQAVASSMSTAQAAAKDSLGNIYVVGSAYSGIGIRWIVRKWNGSVWSVIDEYQSAPGRESQAYGIVIDSSNQIYVGGYSKDSTNTPRWIVRKWNGSVWATIDDFQHTTGFTAVASELAVDSSNSVYVAGYGYQSATIQRWIIRKWDGSSWSTLDDYQYPGASQSAAASIAVQATNNIYAVGWGTISGVYHWVVRRWDGSSWSTVDDFLYGGATNSQANGIAIQAANSIYVAGSVPNQRWLVRKWNGTTWSTVDDYQYSPPPAFMQLGTAYKVALDSGGNVYVAGTGWGTDYVYRWLVRKSINAGSTWTLTDDFRNGGTDWSYARALVTDSTNVYVVGNSTSATTLPWIVRKWNGSSWSTVDSFMYTSTVASMNASGMAVDPSNNRIYVAGDSDQYRWLVRKWDGAAWSVSDDFQYSPTQRSLAQAAASDSVGRIYVIGQGRDSSASNTNYHWLVRKFDGVAWNTTDDLEYANGSGLDSLPSGLVITSTDQVFVAGQVMGSANYRWFVRRWNGTAWSTSDDYLYGGTALMNGATAIAKGPSDQIYVAGWSLGGRRVIRKWNGSSWSVFNDILTTAGEMTVPIALHVNSDSDIYMAGYGYHSTTLYHWWVLKWNGSAWQVLDDYQYTPGKDAQPTGMVVESSGNIYVSGWADDGSGIKRWIVRKFNGHSWNTIQDYKMEASSGATASFLSKTPSGALYIGGSGFLQTNAGHWLVRMLE